jgi:hypothetical protein
MKIQLFSSGADEKEPIFIEFISSAYFRRWADENSYFRRQLAYFRRLLADENILFSYSGGTPPCTPLPLFLFANRVQKGNFFRPSERATCFPIATYVIFVGPPDLRTLITTYGELASDATRASPRLHAASYVQ